MKVNAKMKFLGCEKGVSSAGKPYFIIGLLQGMKSERVYVNEEMYKKADALPSFSDVECELNIQIGERTYINLESINLAEKTGGK